MIIQSPQCHPGWVTGFLGTQEYNTPGGVVCQGVTGNLLRGRGVRLLKDRRVAYDP